MKILLINKFLYPKGGDAISTLTTGNILKKNGHEIIFWGMKHPDNPEYFFQDYFVSQTDYESAGSLRTRIISALNILYSFEARKKIKRLLQKTRPDIVHLNNFAHQISPSILNEIKKLNIPVVMTMRDYKMVCPAYSMLSHGHSCEKCRHGRYYFCGLNRCTKSSLIKSLINVAEMYLHHKILHIYDKIDIYISPSLFLKNKVMKMGLKGEIIHLSNCVNIKNFEPSYEWEEKAIVYVGRLSEEKGIKTLINAVKEIDDVKLKIIGDGPLKKSLQAEILADNTDNIEFTGYLTGKNLHDEIKKSMFLVIPSECYENNPRAVIEAFALGKPALGARTGGIPELVRDWETGLTFTSGDREDLKNKIYAMLAAGNKISEMGRRARKHVELEINSQIHYEKLMKIYEKAFAQYFPFYPHILKSQFQWFIFCKCFFINFHKSFIMYLGI